MRITVLGAGAWGTALAKVLHENGNAVTLWDINTETLDELRHGRSEQYLPGVQLPMDWKAEADFGKAVGGAECCVMAIPSQSFRQVAAKLQGHPAIFVTVTKGVEFETGETMSRILREHAPANRVAALVRSELRARGRAGHSDDGGLRQRERWHGQDGAGTFSPPGISHLPQRGRSRRGIRRRVEKRHRHRRGRERRPRLRRQHEGRTGHAGAVRNAPARRGVRRAGGNFFRLERPRRFDADVFLEAKPQPRFGRAAGARRNDGGNPGVASQAGGGLSHSAFGAPAGAAEKRADADH